MKRRKAGLFILMLFCCFSLSGQTEITEVPRFESIEEMLTFAMKQQRKPYRIGAEGPNAFDCSGFSRYCYKQLGIELSRSSQEQAKEGKKVRRRRLREGDLVFFKGTEGRKINHVGIVFKKRGGKKFDFIHASTSSGIIMESSEVEYFKKRYKTARRITSDRDIKKALKAIRKEQKEREKQEKEFAKQQKKAEKERRKREKEYLEEQKELLQENREEPEKNKVSGKRYIVRKGDTLYNISKRARCTVEEIKKWNNLRGNEINLGQELIISD